MPCSRGFAASARTTAPSFTGGEREDQRIDLAGVPTVRCLARADVADDAICLRRRLYCAGVANSVARIRLARFSIRSCSLPAGRATSPCTRPACPVPSRMVLTPCRARRDVCRRRAARACAGIDQGACGDGARARLRPSREAKSGAGQDVGPRPICIRLRLPSGRCARLPLRRPAARERDQAKYCAQQTEQEQRAAV